MAKATKTPERITPKNVRTIPSKKTAPIKKKETDLEALKRENAELKREQKATAVEMLERENKELKRLLAARKEFKTSGKDDLKDTQDVTKVAEERVVLMERILSKQKKVHMNIPLDIGEKRGSTIPVCINGWVKYYPKGKMIEVPQGVFDILAAHYDLTDKAGEEYEVDRVDDKTKERIEALS